MAKKSEIEKLSEKVEKDPSSTLFVRLAEEYRKAGRLDEAIEVLTSGIERQPSYVSARVALGKAYLEKGMLPEARDVFAQVAEAIPDNLFAHRKLGDIHRELGDLGHALAAYETVVALSPMDEEAQDIIRQLRESGVEPPPPDEPEPEGEEASPQAEPEPQAVEEEPEAPPEDLPFEASEMIGLDEAPDWSGAFTSDKEEEGHEKETHEGGISPVDFSAFGESLMPLSEEAAPEVEELPVEEAPAEVEEAGPAEEAAPEVEELPVEEAPAEVEEAGPAEEAEELGLESFKGLSDDGEALAKAEHGTLAREEEPDEGLKVADSLIKEGRYTEVMDVYHARLEKNPEDRIVLQRVGELKGLLKLLGKDTEQVELKLQAFLEAIKARRNEFFGHSERHG
jgi:tetratricopeptide (TPR) repeat protein